MSSEQHDSSGTKTIDKPAEPTSEAKPTGAASKTVPELNSGEREEVGKRTRPSAVVVHEAVREEGEQQLARSSLSLAWSGLAAGLSMGFSLVAQGLIHTYLRGVPWGPLLDDFGYSVGFLIVVLGRQQLFTENTLTVILPLLAHPSLHTLWKVFRLWTVVLVANLVGALAFAFILGHTSLFSVEIQRSFAEIAQHSLRGGFGLTILRGVFAGWLIALMVWLLPASEGTRLHIIIVLTYLVALGGFAHIIAGSVDLFYLATIGTISWGTYFIGFMIPTLIGNIIGGTSLVAALNFAQVASGNAGKG